MPFPMRRIGSAGCSEYVDYVLVMKGGAMSARMQWATENEQGLLTLHATKADAQKVQMWGNNLTLRRVRVYA